MQDTTEMLSTLIGVLVAARIRRNEYDSVEAVECDVQSELSSIQCASEALSAIGSRPLLYAVAALHCEQVYRHCDAEEVVRSAVALFNARQRRS